MRFGTRNQALEAQGTRPGPVPQGTRGPPRPGQPSGCFSTQLEPLIGKPNWGIMDSITNGLTHGDVTRLRILYNGVMQDITLMLAGSMGGGFFTSATLPLSITRGALSIDLNGLCTTAYTPLGNKLHSGWPTYPGNKLHFGYFVFWYSCKPPHSAPD